MIIGKSSHQKWRDQRRTILTDIIADDPTVRWSVRKIADAMRDHPLIAQNQPDYGHMTAWRDWGVIRKDLADRREEIAADYIARQLDITDGMLEELQTDFENLSSINFDKIEDEAVRGKILVESLRTKKDIVAAIDRLLGRQQTLVPIAIPKKIKVDSTHTSLNLDTLLEYKKEALRAELELGNVIEGELVD